MPALFYKKFPIPTCKTGDVFEYCIIILWKLFDIQKITYHFLEILMVQSIKKIGKISNNHDTLAFIPNSIKSRFCKVNIIFTQIISISNRYTVNNRIFDPFIVCLVKQESITLINTTV